MRATLDDVPSASPKPTLSEFPYWLTVAAIIFAVKGLFFWVDPVPMFFLGDSQSYLETAVHGWIPTDRSFTYGYVIRFFAVNTGSLVPLLAAQIIASALAALSATFILRRYLNTSPLLAALMGILCALEPLQLMFERYVMTEPFSTGLFALFVTIAIGYLKHPSWVRIGLLQITGVSLISFRIGFLPAVQAVTLLLPLFALWGKSEPPEQFARWTLFSRELRFPRRGMRVASHLMLSIILFLGLHAGYKRVFASLVQRGLPNAQPAYNYKNGFFLLSLVGPIVKPCDFPVPDKVNAVFDQLSFRLDDYQMRNQQLWVKGGLIDRLQANCSDILEANRLAELTAQNAVKRNPLGELSLIMISYADWWNPDRLLPYMKRDRGNRELPPELLTMLKENFNLDGAPLPHLSTVTNRYFFSAWRWYLGLLLLPLPAGYLIWKSPRKNKPQYILLFGFVFLQIAVAIVLSVQPTVRFLHPIAWLSTLVLGAVLRQVQIGSAPVQFEPGERSA